MSHLQYINKPRLCNFMLCLILSTGCTIARGLVVPCGAAYWLLLLATCAVGFTAVCINTFLLQGAVKRGDRKTILMGCDNPDILSKTSYFAKYSAIGFCAGIIAASMGVGGGLVKNPLMFSMGVAPYVARAASSSMIAFTSFSSTA